LDRGASDTAAEESFPHQRLALDKQQMGGVRTGGWERIIGEEQDRVPRCIPVLSYVYDWVLNLMIVTVIG
jgi:hypothetical protein